MMPKTRFTGGLVLVLAIMGGTAIPATANHVHDDDQDALVGVGNDSNVQAPIEACHNDVPVNVLGVQVPVQEIFASLGIPVLSDESPATGPDSSCDQNAGQENEGGQANRGPGQESGPETVAGEDDEEGLLEELL